jgi:hypothetical protein
MGEFFSNWRKKKFNFFLGGFSVTRFWKNKFRKTTRFLYHFCSRDFPLKLKKSVELEFFTWKKKNFPNPFVKKKKKKKKQNKSPEKKNKKTKKNTGSK